MPIQRRISFNLNLRKVTAIFAKDASVLKSDCDDQLIICNNIIFKSKVFHSIRLSNYTQSKSFQK
jgi:hypothetical protein